MRFLLAAILASLAVPAGAQTVELDAARALLPAGLAAPVRTYRLVLVGNGQVASAKVVDGVVWVNEASRPYRLAKRDARELAAVLAHEAAHVAGAGERKAYGVQLAELRRLGVSGRGLREVEKAAAEVAGIAMR